MTTVAWTVSVWVLLVSTIPETVKSSSPSTKSSSIVSIVNVASKSPAGIVTVVITSL